MKKRILAVLLAAVMVTSMVACGNNDSGSNTGDTGNNTNTGDTGNDTTDTTPDDGGDQDAPEEVAYDFGGAVVRVSNNAFDDLREENSGNVSYETSWDIAHQIEQKYNITIEYAPLVNDDGYDTDVAILQGITNGLCFADIFCPGDYETIQLRDYLADITDTVDQLEIGSIYVEAGTWNGHVYGWTFDNMGSAYVMVYSRDYLDSIGMDVTPTDMFEQGKWSYDDAIEYLTELKSHLGDGEYPMGFHSNWWASMAPAANGVVSISSDGTINLADERYVSALEFYRTLVDNGLAAPIEDAYVTETGGIGYDTIYGTGSLSGVNGANQIVLTMAEAWQMEGLYDSIGEWGIVPWPWDPQYVTCDGDYTTLSEDYLVPQSIWTNCVVPQSQYRGDGAKDIPDIVLHMIAKDYFDMKNENGAKVRHEMWEAEQAGQTYVNQGYTPGVMGSFSTTQDVTIYDWLHSRACVDWGHALNGTVMVNRNAANVIAMGADGRASGESYTASGEESLKSLGLK